jgi:hypothetical protein
MIMASRHPGFGSIMQTAAALTNLLYFYKL